MKQNYWKTAAQKNITSYLAFVLDIQDVRVYGHDRFVGRVQVRVNGTWGDICGESVGRNSSGPHYTFNANAANVICTNIPG